MTIEIRLDVENTKKVIVGQQGKKGSGQIFVPKEWAGREALVCLLPREETIQSKPKASEFLEAAESG